MSPIELAIFVNRVDAICQEMGVVLRQAAFSPNIKDRLDFSCALFDVHGELFAQAAHIPVHLGSMAYAMRDIVSNQSWAPGDVLAVNDPFLGGTHLPDVTIVSPYFYGDTLKGFVTNRAHHANIGAATPGSMPISTSLEEEGLVIPPTFLIKAGEVNEEAMGQLDALSSEEVSGDFSAQISANRIGLDRLAGLVDDIGADRLDQGIDEMNAYGERVALSGLAEIPEGDYTFTDYLDGDGVDERAIRIQVAVRVRRDSVTVDFEGTDEQVRGNVNCPLSVAAAAVFYSFRCLLPPQTPACAGVFKCIELKAPEGCLVNARRPAATAAGNVETSMRIVDCVLGALAQALPDRIPAASQGTMNNIAMGSRDGKPWDYYETIGGGTGASVAHDGVSGIQSHMTNTLNTPIESLESHYPLRIASYRLRTDSGGTGQHQGGNGLVRAFEFLATTEVTLITERRDRGPWGLHGGGAGKPGINTLDGEQLPAKCQLTVKPGQVITLETPGGGGFGA